MSEGHHAPGRRIDRRTVVRGAAWTVPAIYTAAAAPAYAASTCTGTGNCPDLTFGTPSGTSTGVTNGGGSTTAGTWTYTANGTGWSNSNPVGFMPATTTGTYANKGVYFSASAEPTTANRVLTLTQSNPVALRTGCSYVIKYGMIYYATSDPDLVMTVLVGTTVVSTYSTAGKTGTPADGGIQTVNVPAGTTGAVSFRFTFPAAAGTADDLHLYQPSITCS